MPSSASSSRRPAARIYLRDAWHPAVGFLYGWALLFMIESAGWPRWRSTSRGTRCASWDNRNRDHDRGDRRDRGSRSSTHRRQAGSRVVNASVILKVAALAG
jgi:hypothetical protein